MRARASWREIGVGLPVPAARSRVLLSDGRREDNPTCCRRRHRRRRSAPNTAAVTIATLAARLVSFAAHSVVSFFIYVSFLIYLLVYLFSCFTVPVFVRYSKTTTSFVFQLRPFCSFKPNLSRIFFFILTNHLPV